MRLGFTELPQFMRWRDDSLADEDFYQLQNELMEDPRRGDLMRGCGGFRKVRIGDRKRGKGKSGGARAIYLYVPEVDRVVFAFGYSKEMQEDLTSAQREILRNQAADLKQEEILWATKRMP